MSCRPALPLFVTALLASGCYYSTAPAGEADPIAEPLVDECVATAYASTEVALDPEAPPGHAVVFANYPLYSPGYELDRYGDDLTVVVDARFEEHLTETDWGGAGLSDVVLGRAAGETAWRVLADPDAVCPPLPGGVDWPTGP